jgi:hypothetical protein
MVYDAYAEFVFRGSGSAQINLAWALTFGKNILLSNGGTIGSNLLVRACLISCQRTIVIRGPNGSPNSSLQLVSEAHSSYWH